MIKGPRLRLRGVMGFMASVGRTVVASSQKPTSSIFFIILKVEHWIQKLYRKRGNS